jgi:small subunit ribosomal protein S20
MIVFGDTCHARRSMLKYTSAKITGGDDQAGGEKMPNIKSAIKRVSITEKKTAVNKIKRSEIRTSLKKAQSAVAASADNAGELVRNTQAKLDQAAAKGYLHKNTVARRQSKLAKSLKKS